MNHRKLITTLGGPSAVARALGRNQSNVSRWQRDGIPPAAYPAILKLAQRLGIELNLEGLAGANPKFGTRPTSSKAITRKTIRSIDSLGA